MDTGPASIESTALFQKFYQQSEMGNFEFHVQEKGAVKSLLVEKMEGIW